MNFRSSDTNLKKKKLQFLLLKEHDEELFLILRGKAISGIVQEANQQYLPSCP